MRSSRLERDPAIHRNMWRMPDPRRVRTIVGLVAVLVLALSGVGATAPHSTVAAPTSLSVWTGGVNVYRAGVFTTQRSWLWCTAAGVQIVRNIADHETDHTASGQRRYFDWMRGRNRYDLPLSAGVDPAGWTAGLRHFVDDRYRLVSSRTFDGALRSAVTRLRLTGLPVALTVSHGNHGWILTGFRASADPATTSSFTVTSVRVTGPLYGLQTKGGYDMAPDTKLTTAQLKRYFTPWKYAPMSMVWDGRYVSIQPIPRGTPTTPSVPAPRTSAPAADAPSPSATPSPSPTTATRPTVAPIASVVPSAMAIAVAEPTPLDPDAVTAPVGAGEPDVGLLAALFFATALAAAVFVAVRRRPRGTTSPPE